MTDIAETQAAAPVDNIPACNKDSVFKALAEAGIHRVTVEYDGSADSEVAVAGLPDERWGQRIIAFVKRGGAIEAGALDAWCRGLSLADYKRPREYVFVAEIPKSPVGKILRRLLVAGEYRRE